MSAASDNGLLDHEPATGVLHYPLRCAQEYSSKKVHAETLWIFLLVEWDCNAKVLESTAGTRGSEEGLQRIVWEWFREPGELFCV